MPSSLPVRDDAMLRETRWLALFIIPFLVVAFILLYFFPNDTDKTFAWTIKPSMTPMMLAAAYLGGIYFFTGVVQARKWHYAAMGFLPVTAFAGLLGIATILHWDKFNHSHISFYTWAALYFTAPFLVLIVWWRNRQRDPIAPEAGEIILPRTIRLVIGTVGGVTLIVSLFLFLFPTFIMSIWAWTLTPLTSRVVGAMFALPGIVGLQMAFEPRWSAARLILQAQAFSILFILIAVVRAWTDLNTANIVTWLFVGGLSGLLILFAALFVAMERQKAMTREIA